MISICICDDEPALCQELQGMLSQYQTEHELDVYEYHSVSELLNIDAAYDVLFLDIRFHNEDVGVDAARRLRQRGSEAIIVFLTSLMQYAPDGYEADAFRYLIKPVTMEKLSSTMDAIIENIESKRHRFAVVSDAGKVLIEAISVSHIESIARRRVIHTAGQAIETWETMPSLYAKLPKGMFVYLQKGYVSNLSNVRQLKNNIVFLKNGDEISLSRIYKQDFMLSFNRYVGDGR